MKSYTDLIGNTIILEKTPKRIISLVPSQTELLFDLGLEESIIGITKFCIYPHHFKTSKKIIGGTKKVHYEKIRLLDPDIIIANKEENTQEIVEELQKIAPVWTSDIKSLDDNLLMISEFGRIFDCMAKANDLIKRIEFSFKDFSEFMANKEEQKVAYFIWKNPYMVAGSDNFINEMLALNKFKNIYENKSRYPEITLEKISSDGNPDLIFLSSEPYPFKEEDASEIKQLTHHNKIFFVDGEMFSWYGSRILVAFEYFKQLHRIIPCKP